MPVCPRCSTAIGTAEDFLGGCPKCLLGWAVEAHGDPDTIGGYRILGRLGLGGMGVVYRALHPELQREVALKLLAAGEDADRFLREARAAAKLSHPGIVPIFEVGRHEGRPFFVMEKVDGGPISGPIPPLDAARILAEAARALHYAHRAGIVHRDVKPSNILIGSDGRPRIADFGVARDLGRTTQVTTVGVIVGTPSYMAPEQILGESGPSVDLFALGATLYEILTGRAPFRGIERPDPPRPGGPRDLEIVCLKALEKDPARRYPSCEAFAEDLERFVRGEPILARPPSPLLRLARVLRRNAVAITIVACLGFAFAMALRPRPAAPPPPADETAARELFAEAGTLTAPGVAERRHKLLRQALAEAKTDALVRRIEDRLGRGDALPWFAFALTGRPPRIDGPPELLRAIESLEVEDARTAIENDPNSWRAWLVLVSAHLRDGNPSEAREAARRARLLAPDLRASQAFEALALRARWLFAGTDEPDPLVDRSDPVAALAAAVLPRVEIDREGRLSFAIEDPPGAIGEVPPDLIPLRAWSRLSFGDLAEPDAGTPEWRAFVRALRAANDRTPWVLLAQARRGDVEARIAALLETLGPADPWKDLAYRWPGLVLLAESRLARGDRAAAKAALEGVPASMIENHPTLADLRR